MSVTRVVKKSFFAPVFFFGRFYFYFFLVIFCFFGSLFAFSLKKFSSSIHTGDFHII